MKLRPLPSLSSKNFQRNQPDAVISVNTEMSDVKWQVEKSEKRAPGDSSSRGRPPGGEDAWSGPRRKGKIWEEVVK